MRAQVLGRGVTCRGLQGIGVALVLLGFGAAAGAQPIDDTPTPIPTVTATPIVSPTPGVCSDVQACVDQGVPQLVSSCKAASSSCAQSSTVFAVTATDIADRAIADARCERQKVTRKRSRCNACYRAAKAPLQARFGGRLFKGLLAQAVRVIETKRIAACGSNF